MFAVSLHKNANIETKENLWKKVFPYENLIQKRDDAPGNLQQWEMQSGLQRDNYPNKL